MADQGQSVLGETARFTSANGMDEVITKSSPTGGAVAWLGIFGLLLLVVVGSGLPVGCGDAPQDAAPGDLSAGARPGPQTQSGGPAVPRVDRVSTCAQQARLTSAQDDAMQIVERYRQLADSPGLTTEKAAALRAEVDRASESIRTRGILDIHTLEEIAEPIRDRNTPQPRRMSARDDALRIVLSYLQLAETRGVTSEESDRLYAAANSAIRSIRTRDVLDIHALDEIAEPIRDQLVP